MYVRLIVWNLGDVCSLFSSDNGMEVHHFGLKLL